jgi:hypothetical protein
MTVDTHNNTERGGGGVNNIALTFCIFLSFQPVKLFRNAHLMTDTSRNQNSHLSYLEVCT